ncbi:FAD-dependent oxidoreductase [uncultured Croceicoccus sp.]|jgi:3-phenylpropionate/trans-cinnamate dioxygenase ferredoxin reductase component|uniref:NAD(P)/FAD-dependent oxidoreductase n=1 Tax=uncultured Croceicoccus sp. TaxID=1295329 RepID=UPI00263815C4|nr:FAD-dependent oxidoreductase [uncultured Croceicoccus sp.]
MRMYDVVIVGSGHGGAQAAISLRQFGFEGSILMVSRDTELPYERPPLSKEYLAGEKPFERLLIRPAEFWNSKNIEIELDCDMVSIDAESHVASSADGRQFAYGSLVWAAGGEPRMLSCPGADLQGVHGVRSRADVDHIAASLRSGANRIVVIGGGYIGLEAAAVLRKMRREVVLVEALPRVLSRVAGETISHFVQSMHKGQGVDLRLGVGVKRLVGDGSNVSGVELTDGTHIPADMVIVGIGIIPSVEPVKRAGVSGENGVDVDEQCKTSVADIYAIGDCACHTNAWAGGAHLRVESVQNASDMATTVAKVLCGQDAAYDAIPWFWSNQYDCRMQTAGLSVDYDQTVVRGLVAEAKFSLVYCKDGRISAIDCINNTKDYVQARKLIETRKVVDSVRLADASVPLKALGDL